MNEASNAKSVMMLDEIVKEALYDMLAEGRDVPAGEEFEVLEKAAREKYDAAVARLKAYDVNHAKHELYLKKFKDVSVQLKSQKKARSALLSDPATAYDHSLVQLSRDKLENDVKKAREALGSFDPSAVDYAVVRKPKVIRSSQPEPFDAKGALHSLKKFKSLKWHRWPRTSKKYEPSMVGTGPGEERLAHLFGAKVVGGSESYDIIMPNGTTWEVKQIVSASDPLRPGTEGKKAVDNARRRINRIMVQLKNFTSLARKLNVKELVPQRNAAQIELIATFVDEQFEQIVGAGELSRRTMIDIRSVLKTAKDFKDVVGSAEGTDGVVKDKQKVAFNDVEVEVDKQTYVSLARAVRKATGKNDVITDVNAFDMLLSTLKDKAFENVTAFLNEWFESVDPDDVFSKVTGGMFIVNQRGFIIVPKDMIGSVLQFERITQGMPRYSFKAYGSGP